MRRRRIIRVKIKQAFTVLVMCMAMAVVPAGDVNAEDIGTGSTETEMQEAAEYDLEKGGTQSFEMVDENGEETEIVVEEVLGIARVANGFLLLQPSSVGLTSLPSQIYRRSLSLKARD